MDSNELIKKVRKIEIKTRGLSQNIFAGEYHSAFKGNHLQHIFEKLNVKSTVEAVTKAIRLGYIPPVC